MIPTLTALAVITQFLRSAFLVGGVIFGAVAAADWAVRTRRLNPFGGVARFLRAQVDPRLGGVERQVMRAGGRASATPWWALVLYILVALFTLSALGMIAALVQELGMASALGTVGFLVLAVRWTFGLLRLALLVRVLSSWFPGLGASRWVRWSYSATEWMLRPLRRLIPSIGVIDVTPIVAYFALQILQSPVESIFTGTLR